MNCIACGKRLEDGTAWARVEFQGLQTLRLNGQLLYVHARCFRLVLPEAPPIETWTAPAPKMRHARLFQDDLA